MALVIDFLRFALRDPVFRVHAPDALRLLRLEFDDGHALAVLGEEALVRNIAGDGRREYDHAIMRAAFPVGESCDYPTECAGRSNACYRSDSCARLIAAAKMLGRVLINLG